MAGNTFGLAFRVTSFGESHGPAIGCIVDGCPPRVPLSTDDLARDLARRRPGSSQYVTQRKESDEAEILSGVFEGVTTGCPIAILIRNLDSKPKDYEELRDKFRPGHGDYVYWKKYGVKDHRGGGRASARETASRVAAGAIARRVLADMFAVNIRAHLLQMGDIKAPFESWETTAQNPFFSANATAVEKMAEHITELRRLGDSCGAIVRVVADGIPVGLGEPVFDRLDADIAKALMSINAVKGVSIGAGFGAALQKGSEHGDEMNATGMLSNNAGGILGGISTGQQIEAHLAIKPTSSIRIPKKTITKNGEETTVQTTGRHDPCVGIRAVPVAEAMMALTLVDHALRWRGQCGDDKNSPGEKK